MGFALALWLAGCTPGALPLERRSTTLSQATLRRVEDLYLHPGRLDREFLVGALDALELRFDTVRFSHAPGSDQGVLEVGPEQARVPLPPEFDFHSYLETLGQTLHFVDAHLDEELEPDEDLELIALRGGLAQLDDYSTIFSSDETEDFQIRFSGRLSGIGARIGRRDGHLTAVGVFPDSPAERGGLRDGDWIVTIDGDPAHPLTLSEAVGRIRGEAGTRIVLGVSRSGERLEVEITRGNVRVPSVEAAGAGYAHVLTVSKGTAREFREKLGELGELDGLVLDLRGNSGGSMMAAEQIADDFLSRGAILRVVGRPGRLIGTPSSKRASRRVRYALPVVVLVDEYTASAAEILSGALSPLQSVTVLGQTTFGKGVIQQVLPLPGQNLLKLTVAEYRLSQDRVVHETGIDPDVRLAPVPANRLGLLAEVPSSEIAYVRAPGEDDLFPIEAAEVLLASPPDEAWAEMRARADETIAAALAEFGASWEEPRELPDPLPRAIEVAAAETTLAAGESRPLELRVTNPNDFPLRDVWLALDAPVPYLENRLSVIGELAPGATARVELPLEPPEGISVDAHPVRLHVLAGRRTLHSSDVTLRVAPRVAPLDILLSREGDEDLRISVRNTGGHRSATLRIGVPGSTRSLEPLESGALEEVTLPIPADPDEVFVSLSGPWVERHVSIPIPDTETRVVPPRIRLTRLERRGRPELQLRADDPRGLRRAWIQIDGQKEAYSDWGGRLQGMLSAVLPELEPPDELDRKEDDQPPGYEVAVMVETLDGVEVIDARRLAALQPEELASP
ncbi:MAG: PDZ domain-containing protein [Proteobacteria bacterium]|nr:PDZ domain-containing protein [Pseudomonadota bacterium]